MKNYIKLFVCVITLYVPAFLCSEKIQQNEESEMVREVQETVVESSDELPDWRYGTGLFLAGKAATIVGDFWYRSRIVTFSGQPVSESLLERLIVRALRFNGRAMGFMGASVFARRFLGSKAKFYKKLALTAILYQGLSAWIHRAVVGSILLYEGEPSQAANYTIGYW